MPVSYLYPFTLVRFSIWQLTVLPLPSSRPAKLFLPNQVKIDAITHSYNGVHVGKLVGGVDRSHLSASDSTGAYFIQNRRAGQSEMRWAKSGQ